MTPMNDIQPLKTSDFDLTPAAVDRIATLMESEDGTIFRVAVLGGGCSGFQYEFRFDQATNDDDLVLNRKATSGVDVQIAIDSMSLEFLSGSQLDFVQELIGSYFQVSNPNATASCGCGTSFAI